MSLFCSDKPPLHSSTNHTQLEPLKHLPLYIFTQSSVYLQNLLEYTVLSYQWLNPRVKVCSVNLISYLAFKDLRRWNSSVTSMLTVCFLEVFSHSLHEIGVSGVGSVRKKIVLFHNGWLFSSIVPIFTFKSLSKEWFNQPAATMALLPKTNQHKVHRELDEVSHTH